MVYDKSIPDVLQLLHLGLGNVDYTIPNDTAVARYVIDGDYFPRYCIVDVADDADTMDTRGAIEETMHTILDYGGTADGLRTTMGLVPGTEIDPDIIESDEYVPIGLGYCLDKRLMSLEVLPLDKCDFKDALSERQIENVMAALNNLSVNLRLPAAEALLQGGFTEWQAYQTCKAFEVGVDVGVISERIANPVLNHVQMHELRHIAVHADFANHDASPYKEDVFKTPSSGEHTAGHLHQARELMETTAVHDIVFPHDWLKLDSRQTEVARHVLKSDIPMDTSEEYVGGTYTADYVNVITMALTESMGKPGIERLMNPDLSVEQVWGFYSATSGGRFTNKQLGMLCDSTYPVAVMEAIRTGLTFGVDAQAVLRLADGSFTPERMESLYLAAGDKGIAPEMLDAIADTSLKPKQVDTLKISFQQSDSVADVEAEKKSMPRSVKYVRQADKADATCSTKPHETTKEPHEASARLGSESHDDKAIRREELE